MTDDATTNQPLAPARRSDVWIRMLLYPRHTLPTTLAPVAVATALAHRDGIMQLRIASLAFVAGWLIHLGGVITDNYFNLRRHEDDEEHADFVRALKAGTITMRELRMAIFGCYAGAVIAGAFLIRSGGLPALFLGIACALASVAYSAGPYPLGDNALGDPLFFTFFGVVAVGSTYYLQAAASSGVIFPLVPPPGSLSLMAVIVAIPISALTTNILVIDNIRDLEYDRRKGERTLAVVIGPRWSRVEYVALLAFAYAIPVVLWATGRFSATVLLPLLSLPYGVLVAREVMRRNSLHELLPMTPRAGQVLLAFSILFAIALW